MPLGLNYAGSHGGVPSVRSRSDLMATVPAVIFRFSWGLLALTPSSQLIVYEPNGKDFKQLASYKVTDSETYASPIVAGNRLFVKDRDSVTLWTID